MKSILQTEDEIQAERLGLLGKGEYLYHKSYNPVFTRITQFGETGLSYQFGYYIRVNH